MAAAKDHLLIVGNVGSHGAERDRQLVEVAGIAGMHQQALEQQGEILALDHAQRQAEATVVAKAELLFDQKVAIILLAAVRDVLAWRIVGQHLLPVEGQGQALQLGHAIAGRVQPTDYSAHAGAGDRIDAHALFLQRLEYADMGEAARRAAGQDQADLRLGRLGCGKWQGDEQ